MSWSTLRESITSRVANPLSLGFIVSWLVWNYRLIIVLVSDGEYFVKLEYIQFWLYPSLSEKFLYYFIGPLVTAVLYLTVYPYPARWAFSMWHKDQLKTRALKQKIEGEKLLSVKESSELLREIYDLENKHMDQIGKLNERIRQLTALSAESLSIAPTQQATGYKDLPSAERSVETVEAGSSASPSHVDRITDMALSILARETAPISALRLQKLLDLSDIRYQYYIGQIASRGLIDITTGTEPVEGRMRSTRFYRLSDSGKAYVVERDLDRPGRDLPLSS